MEKRMDWKLPEAFAERMERLLGQEAEAFFKSYEKERAYGLRYNPLKTGGREGFFCLWEQAGLSPAGLRPVPWCREGFFYEESLRPGKHPLHEAGALSYSRAQRHVGRRSTLTRRPGERILDLCAAPGGKTTHAAGRMMGEGLLVSNEIHPARAKILSQNVERMGIGNAVVTNMAPAELVPFFPEFFDGVLVDAPCSGEGMFRKEEEAGTEWSPEQVLVCAKRQEEILDCAAKMTRPGGRILYSTCTFAPEENEQTAARFLRSIRNFLLRNFPTQTFFPKDARNGPMGIRNFSGRSASGPTERRGRAFPRLVPKPWAGGRSPGTGAETAEEGTAGKRRWRRFKRFCRKTRSPENGFFGASFRFYWETACTWFPRSFWNRFPDFPALRSCAPDWRREY